MTMDRYSGKSILVVLSDELCGLSQDVTTSFYQFMSLVGNSVRILYFVDWFPHCCESVSFMVEVDCCKGDRLFFNVNDWIIILNQNRLPNDFILLLWRAIRNPL